VVRFGATSLEECKQACRLILQFAMISWFFSLNSCLTENILFQLQSTIIAIGCEYSYVSCTVLFVLPSQSNKQCGSTVNRKIKPEAAH